MPVVSALAKSFYSFPFTHNSRWHHGRQVSGKELLVDHLGQFVSRLELSRVSVLGSDIEIDEHDDRRPLLRLVAHPALVTRKRAVVANKAAIIYHPQPITLRLPQPDGRARRPGQSLFLGGRAQQPAGS